MAGIRSCRGRVPGIVVAVALAGCGPRPLFAAEPLIWPVDRGAPAITGTFMEARSGGYHSGLDVRTGGRIAAPVRAPAGGSVIRIRTSPRGYGKALYLRDEGGRTWVFAHLWAFADPIEAEVRKAQAATGRYEQDLTPAEGRLVFAAGEVLALSGETGTGAPHLHVELRDAQGRPMDPLPFLDFSDARPPRIVALRVVPLHPDARVEGDVLPRRFAPGETIRAHGPLRFAAEVSDFTDSAPFPLMVAAVELQVDGRLLWRARQLRFDFAAQERARRELRTDAEGRRWIALYDPGGPVVPGRDGRDGGRLICSQDTGPRSLVLLATDAQGNRSEARWDLVPSAETVEEGAETPEAASSWVTGPRVARVAAGAVPGGRPSLALLAAEGAEPRPVPCGSLDARALAFALPSIEAGVLELRAAGVVVDTVRRLPGGRPGELAFLDGRVWIRSGPDALLEGWAWVDDAPASAAVALPEGAVASPWELHLEESVILRPLLVRERAAAPRAEDLRVWLRRDERGRWRFAALAEPEAGEGVWEGAVDAPGVYVLARDRRPPHLGPAHAGQERLSEGAVLRARPRVVAGVHLPRWPALSIEASDDVSGIDETSFAAWLDGRPYPVRPEPEDDRLWVEWPIDPGPGEHRLVVQVSDRVGHRGLRSLRLRLDDGAGP